MSSLGPKIIKDSYQNLVITGAGGVIMMGNGAGEPNLNASKIVATTGTQTIAGSKTFSSPITVNGTATIEGKITGRGATFNSSAGVELGGTAMSSYFKTNAGGLGTVSGDTLGLVSIGYTNGNNSSLTIQGRRTGDGSNWTSTAVGLLYNVDGTPSVNNQAIWMGSNGNVGIGISTPTAKLDIQGNLKNNAGQLGTTAGNTLNLASIGYTNSNSSSLTIQSRRTGNGSDYTTTAVGLLYSLDGTTPINNQSIWMGSNGNVGIGTSTPTQKLHVDGSIKASGLELTRGELLRWGANNENTDDANITVVNGISDATEMRFRIGDSNDADDRFVFQQGNGAGGSSTAAPMMTIRADGNVGIGTGSPNYRLDVIDGGMRLLNRNAASSIEIGSATTSSQYAYIDLVGDTTYTDYGLRMIRGNTGPDAVSQILHRGIGTFTIATQDNADLVLSTNNQGRLLVGKNGTTTANGALVVNGNLSVNGSITANSVGLSNQSASLSSDVSMPSSDIWYGGPSLSLPAGTWLIQGHITFVRAATTATTWFGRISNVLNAVYATSQMYTASVNGISCNVSLTSIVTLASTTTIRLEGANNAGNAACLMKAQLTSNGSSSNTATQITAVRIS